MDDKLFARVTFQNSLMNYFNKYYDLAQYAMTTASIRSRDEYIEMQGILGDFASYAENLIEEIPKNEDDNFKNDTKAFLELIISRLNNIIERYKKLENKKFDGEHYSFFDDRVYIKKDRELEKGISNLGIKMNEYKEETRRMLG